MKRGQLSIEFGLILGVLVILLASVTFPLFQSSQEDVGRMKRLSEGREAASELANALNMVYSGGVGSRQTVELSLPENSSEITVREEIGDSENRIDVLVLFEQGDENVRVNTVMSTENHEKWGRYPKIDNLEDLELDNHEKRYALRVEYRYSDRIEIDVEEVPQ